MHTHSRTIIEGIVGIAILFTIVELFHLGGIAWQFSPLAGALIGGSLTVLATRFPHHMGERTEPWIGKERLAWTLIGCGMLMWGFGESIWRYYILNHQSPFPSLADIGYSGFPPLVFLGLLLQPSSEAGRGRKFILLDSLIAMGSMLAIGWYLLLGSLALASSENQLSKFLGLYYPIADIALLSCVVLLMLRGREQGSFNLATSRRVAFLLIGVGLYLFAVSDFIFNVQQNAGTYIEGTWSDLGWPLGMLAIGTAAYLRRFLPRTPENTMMQRVRRHATRHSFGPAQIVPYILVAMLFLVLSLNVFSADPMQIALRPTLLMATIAVVGLVVLRQILTMRDNDQLAKQQTEALQDLEEANKRIEEQALLMARRNAELEQGIQHLKTAQAHLANGDLGTRARLSGGALLPLALSFNLMAERLMRLGEAHAYAQGQARALAELGAALEQAMEGPFTPPPSALQYPEINRILVVLRRRELAKMVSSNAVAGQEQVTPQRVPPAPHRHPPTHSSPGTTGAHSWEPSTLTTPGNKQSPNPTRTTVPLDGPPSPLKQSDMNWRS